MNNRANRDRAAKLMGAHDGTGGTAGIGTSTSEPSLPSPQRGLNGNMKDPLAALSLFMDPNSFTQAPTAEPAHPLVGIISPQTDYLAKFISQAPDAVRGWQLVQFYFSHLEWYSRVLHAPTFLNECKTLLSLPINAVSARVRPAFLATYFMVLCLALQFIEESERVNLGLTVEEAQTYCTNMFSAVQSLLFLCDFLGQHSLEHLQIIALMGVYQYNVGQADSHWALLGSAIKVRYRPNLMKLMPFSLDLACNYLFPSVDRPEYWHVAPRDRAQ